MTRFWIGIALMALLLATGLYSVHTIEASHRPIIQALEQSAQTQDPEEASALLRNARRKWENHWHGTAVLSEHRSMDEIDSLFAQAEGYADGGKTADLHAACRRLAQLIQASADEHRPTWWNFL